LKKSDELINEQLNFFNLENRQQLHNFFISKKKKLFFTLIFKFDSVKTKQS